MQQLIFKERIREAPHQSGVYFFKDQQGAILYIGKAKDLFARLSSYLSADDLYAKSYAIIEASEKIEWTITKTELDAMLLEATLIQQHKPSFNVLLKEGNPFLYFLITNQKIPELLLTRHRTAKGTYFGPFIDKKSTRHMFSFLLKKFRLKLCNKKISNGCMQYHLGICAGSCLAVFDVQAYKKRLSYVKTFLTKGYQSCEQELSTALNESNKALTFEYSRELVALKKSLEIFASSLRSTVLIQNSTSLYKSIDVWIFNKELGLLTCYQEEHAVLTSMGNWYIDGLDVSSCQEYFLSLYRERSPTQIVLTNFILADHVLIESFLMTWHQFETPIHIIVNASSGHYQNIVSLAVQTQEKVFLQQGLAAAQIKEACKLDMLQQNIDCFDISHMQGTVVVGASIRFTDGKPNPSCFRNFIIKSFEGNNDYAALQEIVSRRYKEAADFPDLMLIDGGKGQRNAVKNIFPHIPCISLAKKEERLFANAHPQGIILDRKSPMGQLLIALRDYTHHAAISFHKKRTKNERLLKKE